MKRNVYLVLLILFGFVIILTYQNKTPIDLTSPLKIPEKTRLKPTLKNPNTNNTSTAPTPSLQPGLDTITPGSPDRPSQKPKTRKGVCQLEEPDKRYFPLEIYQWLITAKPKYFVLPSFHEPCLTNSGQTRYKLVSYNPQLDSVSDYWGDFEISYSKIRDVSSMAELASTSEFTTTFFGKKNARAAIESIGKLGVETTDSLGLYELRDLKKAVPRAPIGDYDFFPGIRIVSAATLVEEEKKGTIQIVDLRIQKTKTLAIKPTAEISPLPPFKNDRLLSSPEIEQVHLQFGPKLPPLSKEKLIVFVGAQGGQKLPFNMANLYKRVGYNNVAVLKNGQLAFDNATNITPESAPSVIRKTMKDFKKDLKEKPKELVIVDTRWEKPVNSPVLKNSWAAPVYLYPEIDYSIPENRKKVTLEKINLPKIQKKLQKKKIFLIGSNEYDWGPLILAEKLAGSDIYWLREGFDGLYVQKMLKTLPGKVAKKVRKRQDNANIDGNKKKKKVKKNNTEENINTKKKKRSFILGRKKNGNQPRSGSTSIKPSTQKPVEKDLESKNNKKPPKK